jgi:hypothetical protein
MLPALLVQAALQRRLADLGEEGPESVLLLSVYRARNTPVLAPLVDEAMARGWDARLWALDRIDPSLAASTLGAGGGAKFPLLNRLLDGVDVTRYDWVVVADDDVVLHRGGIHEILDVARLAGLDLVQPAHYELSHHELEFVVRRPLSIARRTTFVEIGPVFACRRPWTGALLPFPPQQTMGWGLELEWFDLERRGAALGVVDAAPVRHLGAVGKGYAKDEQRRRLQALLDARGLRTVEDIQHTIGTWRPWQPRPPWRSRQ